MSKGKARTKLLDHSAGLVEGSAAGESWNFIYQLSTVKHPDYNIGDRVALPDGRVFRYAFCNAARTTGFCMAFNFRGVGSNGGAIIARATNIETATVVGGNSIRVTIAATDGADSLGNIAEDELRGGYLVVFGASNNRENRGIVGNSAMTAAAIAAGNDTMTIYVDGGWTAIHPTTTTLGVEVFSNPWGSLAMLAEDYMSHAGFPAAGTPTTNQYFWVQTWGPCRISAQNFNLGMVAGERQLWFGPDGSMRGDTFKGTSRQLAGFIIQRTSAALGSSPFVMLQICP